ncbi:MAG: bifunctional lysine ketoglutarate reductase /saccharopine dehydrogenase family protein [Bacteroidales bacterium]
MNYKIGIRREDKYFLERRTPLAPKHVKHLADNEKLEVIVEQASGRVFSHEDFINAGATVSDNLDGVPVIFGVKEIPVERFDRGKTYVFFSHVVKGQSYNMPMLNRMKELKCNLIDYEKIEDEQGRRLIFFGHYAGVAGMINTLWGLGMRLKHKGYETPLLRIHQAHTYNSLNEAKALISEVGYEIAEKGFPEGLAPVTIGFTGYGNVSRGAQEILCLLPAKEITPEELLALKGRKKHPNNIFYKVVFEERHLVRPVDPAKGFELQDYYQNPQNYTSIFEYYVPHLSVLMNCMYWDERYPKLITKDFLKRLFSKEEPRLLIIGDITCDVNGSVESTVKATEIQDPLYVYDPFTDDITMGHEGQGILTMAVDILPSELPRESSIAFGDALIDFVPSIATADYNAPFMELQLPTPVKKALILYKGEFTPDYQYLGKYLQDSNAKPK